MKTLIFNGSPRKNGDTAKLIARLSAELGGEIKVVNAYTANVRPCVDCRWCLKNDGCAVKDDMQEIYQDIQDADHIILASPVYFEEITGMLLALMSRLQTYFGARYVRRTEPIQKEKTGGIILVAGSIGPREKAESTAAMLLEQMRCMNLKTIYVGRTDRTPAEEQEGVIEQISALAKQLKDKDE